MCGLDNGLGRQAFDQVGFDFVVEAGLGRGHRDFRAVHLHTLPGFAAGVADLARRADPRPGRRPPCLPRSARPRCARSLWCHTACRQGRWCSVARHACPERKFADSLAVQPVVHELFSGGTAKIAGTSWSVAPGKTLGDRCCRHLSALLRRNSFDGNREFRPLVTGNSGHKSRESSAACS